MDLTLYMSRGTDSDGNGVPYLEAGRFGMYLMRISSHFWVWGFGGAVWVSLSMGFEGDGVSYLRVGCLHLFLFAMLQSQACFCESAANAYRLNCRRASPRPSLNPCEALRGLGGAAFAAP